MADDDYIGSTEAAKLLRVSRQRLQELAELGRVPRKRIGHVWAYRRADVLAVERQLRGRPPGPTYGRKRGAN